MMPRIGMLPCASPGGVRRELSPGIVGGKGRGACVRRPGKPEFAKYQGDLALWPPSRPRRRCGARSRSSPPRPQTAAVRTEPARRAVLADAADPAPRGSGGGGPGGWGRGWGRRESRVPGVAAEEEPLSAAAGAAWKTLASSLAHTTITSTSAPHCPPRAEPENHCLFSHSCRLRHPKQLPPQPLVDFIAVCLV